MLSINLFMPGGLFYLQLLGQVHFLYKGCLDSFLYNIFVEIRKLRFPSSDMGLHCLLMSRLWDARHKWVKTYMSK